jgi:hypothetical protein
MQTLRKPYQPMSLTVIVSEFHLGTLSTHPKNELYEAQKIVQQRIVDVDNEQLDYGEDDNLIQERLLLDEIEAAILYFLE